MSLVLARIDQRLIHGQVALGWVPVLEADCILVADDEVAADDWERDMVISAAPPDVAARVLSIEEAARNLAGDLPGKTLLLVRSPSALRDLVRAGAPVREANVGGLHYREGARRYLDYLYVTTEDVEILHGLSAGGIKLVARDLPGNRAVNLNDELAQGHLEYDQLPAGP